MLAVLLVAWLVAVPLGSSSLPWLASSVRNSALLGAIDEVMPDAGEGAVRRRCATPSTPAASRTCSAAWRPTRVREVPAPDPALAGSAGGGQRPKRSVVKVLGTAPSCCRRIEGSGFVYAAERVMTNAHVVAGTQTVAVEVERRAGTSGRVVVYDPDRDLAVLYVPGLNAPVDAVRQPATPTAAPTRSCSASRWTARTTRSRPGSATSATSPARTSTRPATVTREVYTIRALVRSGNSGGPLVAPDGQVLGVIFAAAADDPNTGSR